MIREETPEERQARLEYQKRYRETHKAERRAYLERNRDRINFLKRLDYALNIDRYKEQKRNWREKNKIRLKVARTYGVSLSRIDKDGNLIHD